MFKRLFFDVETSPNIVYSWRVGSKITLNYENIIKERAIICICWKWEHEDHVWSLKWDKGNDAEMLREFVEVANAADEIIAHNGDRFDIRWMRARCAKHGIPCFPVYKSVDTLKMARSGFLFNSNRLDYLAQFLAGKSKVPTNFDLWKRVVSGDRKALAQMVEYCENDVIMLQDIYEVLSQYMPHKTHIAVLEGGEKWHCPYCTSEKVKLSKTRVTAMGTLRHQMLCECGRYYTVSHTIYNQFMEE